jgi:hypothetical protein
MADVLSAPTTSSAEEVVELSLLLPALHLSELEAAAFQRGMTTGEMVRALVRDFLVGHRREAPTKRRS